MSVLNIPGLTIGDYIDCGFFGAVYKGEDELGRPLAVKLYHRQLGELDAAWNKRRQALLMEGQRLLDAEHERVVRVFSIKEASTDDAIVLLMERCDGGSLGDIYKLRPMAIKELRPLLIDAVMGLQCLHGRGMLHCDIKPSNILRDGAGRAKLGDFGLVTNEVIAGYADFYKVYGGHAAPEIFSTGQMSERTDIWAFGVTMFRLLHGAGYYNTLPWQAPSPEGLINRLRFLPHVPSRWRSLVRATLRDDRSERIQSAAELLERLNRLPSEPNWECDYTHRLTIWRRQTKTQKYEVRWERRSAQRQRWSAESTSVKAGQRRTLGGSPDWRTSGPVGKELAEFFKQHESASG